MDSKADGTYPAGKGATDAATIDPQRDAETELRRTPPVNRSVLRAETLAPVFHRGLAESARRTAVAARTHPARHRGGDRLAPALGSLRPGGAGDGAQIAAVVLPTGGRGGDPREGF